MLKRTVAVATLRHDLLGMAAGRGAMQRALSSCAKSSTYGMI